MMANIPAFSQRNVSVNLATGTAIVNIPIYTLNRGSLSIPVSLQYVAQGIKVNDVTPMGGAGMGWTISGGGAVTRQLRDLPDDIKYDQGSNARLGWLYNANGAKINSFSISNDNNQATCSDETPDVSYINTNLSDNSDLEPDIFSVQAPGLSVNLVFDNASGIFRPVPYQDLKITFTANGTTGNIQSFTIVNNQGITYTFGLSESIIQTVSTSSGSSYFYRNYKLFQNGIIYNIKWNLTQITDPAGNSMNYAYNTIPAISQIIPVNTINGASGNVWTKNLIYNIATTNSLPRVLRCISEGGYDAPLDSVNFQYILGNNLYSYIVQYLNLANGIQYKFDYSTAGNTTHRDYLKDFYLNAGTSCTGSNMYQFAYNGVNFTTGTSVLADSASNSQDYWGYYNASGATSLTPQIYVYPDNPSYPTLERYRIKPIPGYAGTTFTIGTNDRSANTSTVMTSSLSTITYPEGGTTTFTYESNDYFDGGSASVFSGSGIRIKQITTYDGISSSNNIVKNYTYLDPANGLSSGKPISIPQFAFTTVYTGAATGLDYWCNSSIFSETNLSTEDPSIIYSKVTEQQTGIGKKLYEFSNPAMFWDATGGVDWTPTMVDQARIVTSPCSSAGSIKNSKYNYPFPPNTNYDFERTLPTKLTLYNEAGNIVSQTTYSYQRSNATPIKIPAFRFDNLTSAVYSYAKYQVYAFTSELLATQTEYVNDLANTTNNSAQQFSSTTNYYYLSANHKLPTKIERVNTDGSINRTYIKYVKDYVTTTVTDAPSIALQALTNQNINAAVEKYSTVTRASVEKTFGAELTKFGSFPATGVWTGPTLYMPSQSLKFISTAGVTDFAFSTISGAGIFSNYSGYFPVVNYQSYHFLGGLLTADDNNNNTNTQLIDDITLRPVAIAKGAKFTELLYSNADGTDYEYGFQATGATTNSTLARSGKNSINLPGTGLLQRTMSLKANAGNYIYSCFLNAASAGTLTISLYNSASGLFGTKTIAFSATAGTSWNYYEVKMPTAGLSSSFTIKVQTNATVNIDDALFYPESSEVKTMSYDRATFLKTSETNTDGNAHYYSYDSWHRLLFVYDQDKNIVEKHTYVGQGMAGSGTMLPTNIFFTPNTEILPGNQISFSTDPISDCAFGNLYSWNFGDGTTTTPSPTGNAPTHIYSTGGTYTVTETITNSIYGTKVLTTTVNVFSQTLTINTCQSGVFAYDPATHTTYAVACTGNPNDNTHSYFNINSITNGPPSPSYTYEWQINYTDGGSGTGVWTDITPGIPTRLTMSFSTLHPRYYQVRCIVKEDAHKVYGISPVMTMFMGNPS